MMNDLLGFGRLFLFHRRWIEDDIDHSHDF
jgi:hypothetical protein